MCCQEIEDHRSQYHLTIRMKSTIYVIKFLLSFYASTLAKESLNSNHEDLFKEYLKLNNLKFIDQEYLKRLNIFEKNIEIIENHNSLPDVTFKMGITKFSHLSNQEVIKINFLIKNIYGVIFYIRVTSFPF